MKYPIPDLRDIDNALALQKAAAKTVQAYFTESENAILKNSLVDKALDAGLLLADITRSIDKYLSKGGKLPKKWRKRK